MWKASSFEGALERNSSDYRYTKTKVVILANQNRRKHDNERIRVRRKYMYEPAQRVRPNHDWFLILLLIGWESGGNFCQPITE